MRVAAATGRRGVVSRALAGACALVCAGLLSCSSAPKQSDTVITVQTQADQLAASGQGYYRQGRYELALQFFSQALSQYTSVDDGEGIVRSYNAVGKCYIALGQVEPAEGVFLQARERAREDHAASLLFDSSVNLGELYLARGDAVKARAILLEEMQGTASAAGAAGGTGAASAAGAAAGSSGGSAVATGAAVRTPSQTAQLYHDLGTAEKNLGNSAPALDWFDRSLKINLAQKYFAEAASDYYMIASVHSIEGRYDEAMKNASLALAYDKQVESSPGIAKDLYALGMISAKKGDPASAYDWLERSYHVSTTLGFKDDMKKALAGLIAAADALGRTADAETYRKALADMGSS